MNDLADVGAIASELVGGRVLEDVLHDLGNVLLLQVAVKAVQALTNGLVFELESEKKRHMWSRGYTDQLTKEATGDSPVNHLDDLLIRSAQNEADARHHG